MTIAATIKRVTDLLALGAGDASEEEARTSARLAARLIDQHRLRVVGPAGASPSPPPPVSRPTEPEPAWTLTIATQGGWCSRCGKIWWKGERILVAKDHRSIHFGCGG